MRRGETHAILGMPTTGNAEPLASARELPRVASHEACKPGGAGMFCSQIFAGNCGGCGGGGTAGMFGAALVEEEVAPEFGMFGLASARELPRAESADIRETNVRVCSSVELAAAYSQHGSTMCPDGAHSNGNESVPGGSARLRS